jgi:hypothetical protein
MVRSERHGQQQGRRDPDSAGRAEMCKIKGDVGVWVYCQNQNVTNNASARM